MDELIITLEEIVLEFDASEAIGPKGDQGDIGPQGEQGDTGAAGAKGDQGDPGPGVASGGTTGQYLVKSSNTNYDTGWDTLTKSDVGLGNVDNTSDVNKPVSSATQTALDDKVDKVTGKGLSANDYTDADKTRLADTSGTNTGDQDLSGYVPTSRTVNGHALSSDVTVSKSDVGLGNVDNTSDASKPVSTAQQAALDLKEDTANKGTTGGYASLDGSGKVPAAQLPSYVDDVLEYADLASFPATGATGIIYTAIDTGKIYRWSGSTYVEISPTTLTPPGGSDTYVQYNDGGVFSGDANLVWDKTNRRLGIGVTSPQFALDIQAADDVTTNATLTSYKTTATGTNFIGRAARLVAGVPSQVLADDALLIFGGRGYKATTGLAGGNRAKIAFYAAEAFTSSTEGTYITFETTPIGTQATTEKIRITDTGQLQSRVTGSTGGFSWGSGSTQDTNLYRAAADTLKTDDMFQSASFVAAQVATTNQVYLGATASGVAGAGILFGGPGVQDTNLYRSAANVLRSDDNLIVGNTAQNNTALEVGNVISTLGYAGIRNAALSSAITNYALIQDNASSTLLNAITTLVFRVSNVTMATITANSFNFVTNGGKTTLQLSSTAANVGMTIGGDVTLYRSAADVLATDDSLSVGTNLSVTGTTTLATSLTGIVKATSGVLSAVTAPTGAIVGTTDTQTLTNKAITPRINTVTSSATPSINVGTTDQFNITALAADITSMTTNLTGTPVDGQKLLIRIKDNGTARAIAWGASFVSSGVATLLTTTVISKTHLNLFIYDAVATKWVCVAVDATGY